MKINTAVRETEFNSVSSREFTIQNSGKMFHMVISGLYSDKPKSITREIYSNAFDAHAMVGKQDVPFEVVYPTSLNPTFTVRDFGPGIAHEDMEDFYTVLGHSTKEDTNDAVGKWGVGRMSPMSYTDTFSVVSRHKGMEAFYSVQLGAGGEPQLHTLLEPQPTSEPDGLEVSFPIKSQDINLFAKAAREVAVGFDVKPVVRNDGRSFEDPYYTLSGDGFRFFQHADMRGCYAKMGCVMYPIRPAYVPSKLRYSSLVLDFPIGDLDVTASREDLSYDETTIANIEKKFKQVTDSLDDLVNRRVSQSPTYFQACRVFAHALAQWRPDSNPEWFSRKVLSRYINTSIKLPTSRVSSSSRSVKVYWEGGEVPSIEAGQVQRIYIQNITKKTRDVRANERIFLHHKADPQESVWVRYSDENKGELNKLLVELNGSLEIVWVKDIPDPGPRGKSRAVTRLKVAEGNRFVDFDLPDEDFKKGGVYLKISNNCPMTGEHQWYVVNREMAKTGAVYRLIVVPKTHWKKFEDNDNWTQLFDVARKYISTDTEKKKAFAGSHVGKAETLNIARFAEEVGGFPSIRKLVERKDDTMDGLTKYDMSCLLQTLGIRDIDSLEDKILQDIYTQFPLLAFLQHSLHNSEVKNELKLYVKLKSS